MWPDIKYEMACKQQHGGITWHEVYRNALRKKWKRSKAVPVCHAKNNIVYS
jgi:hypothetical protein